MSEFIYILENASFAGVVKIGKTAREVSVRVRELSSPTGVPTEFTVFKQYAVEDATIAERQIHSRLAEYRVSDNRECFRLSAEDAALIVDEMLKPTAPTRPDPEREDELFFAATEIAVSLGKIWPGVLAGRLKISHQEAEGLVRGLQARGIVNAECTLCADLRAEHMKREREEWRKLLDESATALARSKEHYQQIQQIKKALAGFVDPETGRPVEVSFDNNNGTLVVVIHGSEQVKLEAERRISEWPDDEQEASEAVASSGQMTEVFTPAQKGGHQPQPHPYRARIIVACLLFAPIVVFLLWAANGNKKHSAQSTESGSERGVTLPDTNSSGDLTNALPKEK